MMKGTRTAPELWYHPLSKAQARVALVVAKGLTDREVGEFLHLSPATIRSHMKVALSKLEVHSRTELAFWVYSQRWGYPVTRSESEMVDNYMSRHMEHHDRGQEACSDVCRRAALRMAMNRIVQERGERIEWL